MWRDLERERTYRAEKAWLDGAPQEARYGDLERCHGLLATIIPPVLLERVTLEEVPANEHSDGRLDYTEWFQYRLAFKLPCEPYTVVHEAAHLLLEAIGGSEHHARDYRATLIWLVWQVYGARQAKRLEAAFLEEGLTCE